MYLDCIGSRTPSNGCNRWESYFFRLEMRFTNYQIKLHRNDLRNQTQLFLSWMVPSSLKALFSHFQTQQQKASPTIGVSYCPQTITLTRRRSSIRRCWSAAPGWHSRSQRTSTSAESYCLQRWSQATKFYLKYWCIKKHNIYSISKYFPRLKICLCVTQKVRTLFRKHLVYFLN